MKLIALAVVVAGGLIATSIAWLGRYDVEIRDLQVNSDRVAVLDRWTGQLRSCSLFWRGMKSDGVPELYCASVALADAKRSGQ